MTGGRQRTLRIGPITYFEPGIHESRIPGMDTTLSSFTKYFTSDKLFSMLFTLGWKVLAAAIVLIIGMILIKVSTSVLHGAMKRTVRDATVRRYVMNATKILLWIILMVIILGVFGIETTSVTAMLAAAGLAIGLALQGSLSNIAAGFMLLLFRPFRAGDDVEIAGVTGTVYEIGIFSTTIDTPENVRAFVPNSSIFSGVIKNRSINGQLRVEVRITVDKTSDINRVQQLLQRSLAGNDLVMEVPPPDVHLVDDAAAGITFAIRPYTKQKNLDAVRTSIARAARDELRAAGIDLVK